MLTRIKLCPRDISSWMTSGMFTDFFLLDECDDWKTVLWSTNAKIRHLRNARKLSSLCPIILLHHILWRLKAVKRSGNLLYPFKEEVCRGSRLGRAHVDLSVAHSMILSWAAVENMTRRWPFHFFFFFTLNLKLYHPLCFPRDQLHGGLYLLLTPFNQALKRALVACCTCRYQAEITLGSLFFLFLLCKNKSDMVMWTG